MDETAAPEAREIVVVGHRGVGKSALMAAMLHVAKATPRAAGLAGAGQLLDDTPEEEAHAATLETRMVSLIWNGKRVNLIDTPGEGSLSADTRMALAAADAVLLVVSARDGFQSGTERAWQWTRELGLPCLVVVSRADDEYARWDEVLSEMSKQLGLPVAPLTVPVRGGATGLRGVATAFGTRAWVEAPEGPPEAASAGPPADAEPVRSAARTRLVEEVAGTTDALTDRYLTAGDLTPDELAAGLRIAIGAKALVPVCAASGTAPAGIAPVLDTIVDLLPREKPPVDAPFKAFVFKTRIDQHTGRMSYLRVISGVLRAESEVLNSTRDASERIVQPLQGIGRELKPTPAVIAGDVAVLSKLKTTRTGDTLCDPAHRSVHAPPEIEQPLFERTLVTDKPGMEGKLSTALQRLAEEDAGLRYSLDETSHQLLVRGLGSMHLEITAERIRRRTGVECHLGPPKIAYRETVTRKVSQIEGKQKKQAGGHGQFAVCYIDLQPLARGGGFVFEDAVVGGSVPRQFISSVEKGVVKAMATGILAGHPIVDLHVSLVDGKAHSVDSSDVAFQVAGYRALRAAVLAAHPVLLEPVVKLQVRVPAEMMGDVLGDLNSRRGKVLGTELTETAAVINVFIPFAETLDLEPKLKGMTHGKGTFTLAFHHYDPCPPPVQEKVLKDSGFQATADED